MPIPTFSIDGVLPPYVGTTGPGGAAAAMSPFTASATEVVGSLGGSDPRREILRGWLGHRAALRSIGLDRGFQWLDGSFVENKDPKDLDVLTFLYRPVGFTEPQFNALLAANMGLFARAPVKATYKLDFFAVDLNGSPETLVNFTRYFCGLFSHRRGDDLWKGMLQVRLENVADDGVALGILNPVPAVAAPPAGAAP
jgi:hypothetical protein